MSLLRRIDLREVVDTADAPVDYRAVVPRADFDVEAAVPAVHAICEDVRTRGIDAVRELGERFDGVRVDDIRVAAGNDLLSCRADVVTVDGELVCTAHSVIVARGTAA